jgi:DNA (cytosine-5)-methyltransferase 1
MLNGLDLFSGIGGMSIALQEWVRPIAYCEIDRYCQGVLISRIFDRTIRNAPIWDDIKTFQGNFLPSIDIVYGGFPCQDISVAGRGKGLAGERSILYREILRLAEEIKPTFLFLENVPAICSRMGVQVVREITEMGYDCRWCVISAASVGARHKRDRWFLLAHTLNNGQFTSETRESIRLCNASRRDKLSENCGEIERASSLPSDVANPRFQCERCLQGSREEDRSSFHDPRCCRFWETEPDVGRVADGIPQRTHRIRALGNAVVSQQAKEAFKILMGLN